MLLCYRNRLYLQMGSIILILYFESQLYCVSSSVSVPAIHFPQIPKDGPLLQSAQVPWRAWGAWGARLGHLICMILIVLLVPSVISGDICQQKNKLRSVTPSTKWFNKESWTERIDAEGSWVIPLRPRLQGDELEDNHSGLVDGDDAWKQNRQAWVLGWQPTWNDNCIHNIHIYIFIFVCICNILEMIKCNYHWIITAAKDCLVLT